MNVALIATPSSSLAERLRDSMTRESMHVDVMTAEVLRQPPQPIVHVFVFDEVLVLRFADSIAAWARHGKESAGLIGIVEDGAGGDRETLLAAGFDDALTGRPSPRELIARIRAVRRRLQSTAASTRLRYGPFTLDVGERVLWIENESVHLTAIELAVMRALTRARGRPLSRLALLDVAWGGGSVETTQRAVDNVILRLRRKMPRPELIETVRGVGFRLSSRIRC